MNLISAMRTIDLVANFIAGNRYAFIALRAIEIDIGVSGRQTDSPL